jgi:hypothetical protein
VNHWLQFIDVPIAALAVILAIIAIGGVVAVVFRLTSSKYGMRLHWKGGAIELKPAHAPQPQLEEPPTTAIVKRE